ncbi:MAG: hypothetical protein AB1714_06985 [Acidobacteriota bacterium]
MTSRRPGRFAVVTEGPSDYLVLRAVIRKVFPGAEVVPVHPEVPLAAYPEYHRAAGTGGRGTGWRGVKAWCEDYGDTLRLFMRAVVGDEYDALGIHIDASMADKVGAERPCPPARATTDQLRRVVIRDWLGLREMPGFLAFATPSKSTDAWVVAALRIPVQDLECDKAVERLLWQKKHLRMKDGRVLKPRSKYESLAAHVANELALVRKLCTESDRFITDIGRLTPLAP